MRRTELKRGTSRLARGTGLQRGAPMRRTAKERRVPEMAGLTAAEQACLDRDAETCQRCGINLHEQSASKHHRKRRREYDADRVENIVLLCGSGTTGCHGYVHGHPNTARREGWVVWSTKDPEVQPCLTAYGSTGSAPATGNYTSMVMYLADGTRTEDPLVDIPPTAAGLPMWTAS